MQTRIASRRVVTGTIDSSGHAEPARALTIVISDGVISEVREGIEPDAQLIDATLVPGFVDTHTHGAAGAAFVDPDPAAVQRAIDLHRAHGSTTLFASTVTAPVAEVHAQLERLRPFVAAGELRGVHLEGPFISPARKGAHTESLLIDPASEVIDPLVADPIVRMVTLAPELPSGLRAVESCARHGVAAAFGHSDSDAATTAVAVDAGVTIVTHLFNAMRGINHREPGPVPVLLTDPRVMVELICDGVHLAPEIVRLAIAAAGVPRVGLVTDAMAATGESDGDYELGGLAVQVRDGVARLVTSDGTPGAIAGSTLTMDRAVRFLVTQVGVSLPDAAAMASGVPAAWHHLNDVGRIAPGYRADLCVLDDDATLVGVMRSGAWFVAPGRDAA